MMTVSSWHNLSLQIPHWHISMCAPDTKWQIVVWMNCVRCIKIRVSVPSVIWSWWADLSKVNDLNLNFINPFEWWMRERPSKRNQIQINTKRHKRIPGSWTPHHNVMELTIFYTHFSTSCLFILIKLIELIRF